MRKLLVLIFIMVGSFSLLAVPSAAHGNDHPKVTICHRTNSETNPYVQITVDTHAVDGQGGGDHYGQHKGPVYADGLKDQHVKWGDIIPPVAPFHDGLNWTDEGRALYDNGCTSEVVKPTTTTTVPEQTTTTVVEVPTTVASPEGLIPPLTLDAPKPIEELPRTGTATAVLAGLGVALLLAGSILVLQYRSGRT